MYFEQEFYFPDNVGMPIGEPDDNSMFIMETHYNNPEKRMGKFTCIYQYLRLLSYCFLDFYDSNRLYPDLCWSPSHRHSMTGALLKRRIPLESNILEIDIGQHI